MIVRDLAPSSSKKASPPQKTNFQSFVPPALRTLNKPQAPTQPKAAPQSLIPTSIPTKRIAEPPKVEQPKIQATPAPTQSFQAPATSVARAQAALEKSKQNLKEQRSLDEVKPIVNTQEVLEKYKSQASGPVIPKLDADPHNNPFGVEGAKRHRDMQYYTRPNQVMMPKERALKEQRKANLEKVWFGDTEKYDRLVPLKGQTMPDGTQAYIDGKTNRYFAEHADYYNADNIDELGGDMLNAFIKDFPEIITGKAYSPITPAYIGEYLTRAFRNVGTPVSPYEETNPAAFIIKGEDGKEILNDEGERFTEADTIRVYRPPSMDGGEVTEAEILAGEFIDQDTLKIDDKRTMSRSDLEMMERNALSYAHRIELPGGIVLQYLDSADAKKHEDQIPNYALDRNAKQIWQEPIVPGKDSRNRSPFDEGYLAGDALRSTALQEGIPWATVNMMRNAPRMVKQFAIPQAATDALVATQGIDAGEGVSLPYSGFGKSFKESFRPTVYGQHDELQGIQKAAAIASPIAELIVEGTLKRGSKGLAINQDKWITKIVDHIPGVSKLPKGTQSTMKAFVEEAYEEAITAPLNQLAAEGPTDFGKDREIKAGDSDWTYNETAIEKRILNALGYVGEAAWSGGLAGASMSGGMPSGLMRARLSLTRDVQSQLSSGQLSQDQATEVLAEADAFLADLQREQAGILKTIILNQRGPKTISSNPKLQRLVTQTSETSQEKRSPGKQPASPYKKKDD